MARLQTTIDFEFASEIEPSDIASALAIDEFSAQEMLYGRIPFREKEIKEVAAFKGITIDKMMQKRMAPLTTGNP